MFFKQFFLACLAHASYMIGSEGEACVVDPQRDVEQYLEEAEKNGLKIKYILETHVHADFVGGHRELANRTGAEIIFSKRAGAEFQHRGVDDGDSIEFGKVRLDVLATPGHTPESICILVTDKEQSEKPSMVLTGDTLFIGDVGRPDLVGAKGHTSEEMAGLLYDSLRNKLLTLDDEVLVYPAHGAGSLCGKNMSTERFSTIGQQRKFNYALKEMTKEEFISMMCTDLPEVPAYFTAAVAKNKEGAKSLKELSEPKAMTAQQVKEAMDRGHLVVDVRSNTLYGAGHVPGSINIGLGGQFASWAGSLIPMDTPIILVVEEKEGINEAVTRLARAGHESVIGYLDGGIYAWTKSGHDTGETPQITIDQLKEKMEEEGDLQIIDVRRKGEYDAGHVPGAKNIPLGELKRNLDKIDKQRPTAIICASGYRSSISTYILKDSGVTYVYNTIGGTNAWRTAGYEIEMPANAPSCASA
jgi:glyoxylase-like metal-dependent hydrolase (beta-lactamase superfamily II)/rhodanese-related sulfurtransferase